jgi:phage shock protein A
MESKRQESAFEKASKDELCLIVLEKEKEIDKLKNSNKKLRLRVKDLNKKVASLETSLLGTEAMNTYQKAEKDVQSYLKHAKSSDRKEKQVIYPKH